MSYPPEEGAQSFRLGNMTPEASGAQDQPEQSLASTDKLIVKKHRPSEGQLLRSGIAVRENSAVASGQSEAPLKRESINKL